MYPQMFPDLTYLYWSMGCALCMQLCMIPARGRDHELFEGFAINQAGMPSRLVVKHSDQKMIRDHGRARESCTIACKAHITLND